MADQAAPGGVQTPGLIIASDLTPAKASAVREEAMALLAQAEATRTPAYIEMDRAALRPVSLQLLVAARRSATSRGVALYFGPEATKTLDCLEQMQPIGRSDG